MKQTYGIVPKSEVINLMQQTIELLEQSEKAYVFVTVIDTEEKEYRRQKNTVEEGIDMVGRATSVAFSTTPVMGSVDLFDYHIKDIKALDKENIKMKNILFPLRINGV